MSLEETATPITVDAPLTVLVAEDDPGTRMVVSRWLKDAGYEVDAVENGAQAFDKMLARYYPILITDWEMPDMDGIALCKAVRNMRLDGYVYALLLTARDTKAHLIAGLEAGADDYLIKPVERAGIDRAPQHRAADPRAGTFAAGSPTSATGCCRSRTR